MKTSFGGKGWENHLVHNWCAFFFIVLGEFLMAVKKVFYYLHVKELKFLTNQSSQ